MLRLVFDLDGTLLNVSARHYRVYTRCMQEFRARPLSYREYWRRRRSGEGTIQIAAADPAIGRAAFQKLWLELIERPDNLCLDALFEGAVDALELLGERCELVLATLRRDRGALLDQLARLGIDSHFRHILTPGKPLDGSKVPLVLGLGRNGGTCVIGDSEADIALARETESGLVCVANGVRDGSFLAAAGAGRVVPDVRSVPAALQAG